MKYLLATSVCCCCLLIAPAQRIKKPMVNHKGIINPTQLAVNRIDSIVNTINNDSTKGWVTMPDTRKKLTNKYTGKQPGAFTTVNAAYQNGQLVLLQFMVNNNRPWDYSGSAIYFHNGEAVLYIEHLYNRSRMGSCGELSVDFYHYLRDSVAFAGLAKSVTWHYSCYGYQLKKPDHNLLFNEIKRQKALLEKYIQTNPPGPVPALQQLFRFTLDFLLNRRNDVQDQYGF